MFSNARANCGTGGLAHCTGRSHVSQTPHRCLTLPAPTLPHIFSTRDHMASLSLGFFGERKGQPLPGLPTPPTTAPTSTFGATVVPPSTKSPLHHSPASKAVTWPLTVWRCAAARATDGWRQMGRVNSAPGLSISKGLAAKPVSWSAGGKHYLDKSHGGWFILRP